MVKIAIVQAPPGFFIFPLDRPQPGRCGLGHSIEVENLGQISPSLALDFRR
jgi:hypothetical protein